MEFICPSITLPSLPGNITPHVLALPRARKKIDIFSCVLSQILAIGFFVKGVVFPVVLVAFELCLTAKSQNKFVSPKGLRLCAATGVISLLYVGWYFGFASVSHVFIGQRSGLTQVLFDAMLFIVKLGDLLLFLPINNTWSDWVSGAFWIMLACWRIYDRPINAAPIAALLALLVINFAIPIWARGEIFVSPLTAMRYYPEIIVIVSIFTTLALDSKKYCPSLSNDDVEKNLISVLLITLSIIYPVMSYFDNKYLFQTTYRDIKLTHKFMINVQRTLNELNAQDSPKLLQTNFPPFVYAFFAARLPLKGVFDKLYQRIEWIPIDQEKNGINTITDDGFITPLILPDAQSK